MEAHDRLPLTGGPGAQAYVPPPDAWAVSLQYAQDVVAGRVPACKWVRLACQRHLTDLAEGWRRGLFFDLAAAQHVVDFAITCRDPETGQAIALQPWQVFILASVFGWYRHDDDMGQFVRRFKVAYIEVPRKNGKSTLLAVISLYLTSSDGALRAQVFSAASAFKQAMVVWKVAKAMVQSEPVLSEVFNAWATSLEHFPTGSVFLPLHAKDKSLEGLNVYAATVDELHVHPDNRVWNVIRKGTAARPNALLFAITTAGEDVTGFCYQQREYVCTVLQGLATADHYFGVVYTVDDETAWNTEAAWVMANPNWGVTVVPSTLRELYTDALGVPVDLDDFKRKHVGIWVGADAGYYDRDEWAACADPKRDPASLQGLQVFGGIDLARKRDLTAVTWWFTQRLEGERKLKVINPRRGEDGEQEPEEIILRPLVKLHLVSWFYLPKARLRDKKNKNRWRYEEYANRGALRLTDGNATDFDQVFEDILNFSRQHRVVRIGYDPAYANELANNLMTEGIQVGEILQSAKMLTGVMQDLDVMMRDRMVTHDNNPAFNFGLTNVVGHQARGRRAAPKYIMPGKKDGLEENSIDGPMAAYFGLLMIDAKGDEQTAPDDYELLTVG